MFTSRWGLFHLLGFPIYADASWLIILVLLTWTLHTMFKDLLVGYSPGLWWALGLGTALAFFLCILLHELGHAVVARAWGIPIQGITLFLFGGVAELRGEPTSALSEFLTAIAGPVVSAVLAGLCGLLWWLGGQGNWGAPAL